MQRPLRDQCLCWTRSTWRRVRLPDWDVSAELPAGRPGRGAGPALLCRLLQGEPPARAGSHASLPQTPRTGSLRSWPRQVPPPSHGSPRNLGKVSKSIRNFLSTPPRESGVWAERQWPDLRSWSRMDLNAFHVERAFLINCNVPGAPQKYCYLCTTGAFHQNIMIYFTFLAHGSSIFAFLNSCHIQCHFFLFHCWDGSSFGSSWGKCCLNPTFVFDALVKFTLRMP